MTFLKIAVSNDDNVLFLVDYHSLIFSGTSFKYSVSYLSFFVMFEVKTPSFDEARLTSL